VDGRCEYNSNVGDEDHPAEQRIERGKNFASRVRDIYYGPHTTQDHTGIMYRIDPGNPGCVMITEYAYKDAYDHHANPQHKAFQNTFFKNTERGKRLMSGLQHG